MALRPPLAPRPAAGTPRRAQPRPQLRGPEAPLGDPEVAALLARCRDPPGGGRARRGEMEGDCGPLPASLRPALPLPSDARPSRVQGPWDLRTVGKGSWPAGGLGGGPLVPGFRRALALTVLEGSGADL